MLALYDLNVPRKVISYVSAKRWYWTIFSLVITLLKLTFMDGRG